MTKTLFSIIILALFSATLCKEYYMCDSAGKYACSKQQTCCKNKLSATKWACFPTVKGVCCSDGLSCCPNETTCNLRERKCEPKPALTFLTGNEESTEYFYEPNFYFAPVDALAFVEGFFKGITFFENLPHRDQCDLNDKIVVDDIVAISNVLKNLNRHNIMASIEKIIPLFKDSYNRIQNISTGCFAYSQEVREVSNKLLAYIEADGYLNNFSMHILTNIGPIKEKAVASVHLVTEEKYSEAGQGFGDLLKFLIFWDYKN